MARAALLALLLLCSVPMAAASPSAASADPATAQIDLLTLDGEPRSDHVTPSLDVGSALATQHIETEARIDRYALEARFEARAPDDRSSLLLGAVLDANSRTDAIREREATLRAAYRNRSISAPTFLRGLAQVHAEAMAVQATLETVSELADRTEGFSIRQRLAAVENSVVEFQGPVRSRALAATTGEAAPTRLYVSAGPNGVVLSMLQESRYLRSAYRTDRRSGEPEAIPPSEFGELVQVYPNAYDESFRQRLDSSGDGIYTIRYFYQDGFLDVYVHGGDRSVFYEIRDRRRNAILRAETASATANGTRLVANRTYPGGPLRLATTNASSGAPIATTVIVDGYRLETGDDGVVYTLMPDSPRVSVTAVGPQGNVTTSVRPLDLESLNGTG